MAGIVGMIIKNVIVLIDEINVQHGNRVDLYTCIVEATVVRTRPVLMCNNHDLRDGSFVV